MSVSDSAASGFEGKHDGKIVHFLLKDAEPASNDTFRGRSVAYEYDPVWCPKCNTTGKIVCVRPRHDTGPNGKQCALSGDWCLCKCDPHPLLIGRQQDSSTS
ncbi:PAAR domain-containing protein [Paraburkholderia sp. JPY432]|uniref:PAAR domain-containing protein n=1 Tax=Paraburkholderia youngii TaxID=2782701 RepID=UPI00159630A2|nr:PAAR domain-containing protein [Paraburkholderia youngii]